jgi:methylmalonyl-CoA mutase cobalamin-binding subunit
MSRESHRPTLPSEATGNTIRVVAKRTGLSMDLLRAWERRHGFPRPERRPGSNRRLYAEADIVRLLSIRGAIERGYRVGDVIGKTVPQLLALIEAGQDEGRASAGTVAAGDFLALLADDDVGALEAALRRAAGLLGPKRFVCEVAHPLAVAVGEAWASGSLSIRHEKIATECLATRMHAMLAGYQDVSGHPVVLLATPPGEPHALGLQMVALYLVAAGAKPRLLGAPTPTRDVLDAAKALGAQVVGLSVSEAADRRSVALEIRRLRRALTADVHLWVGGSGATALGPLGAGVRLVASWSALDDALDDRRQRPGPPRSGP